MLGGAQGVSLPSDLGVPLSCPSPDLQASGPAAQSHRMCGGSGDAELNESELPLILRVRGESKMKQH